MNPTANQSVNTRQFLTLLPHICTQTDKQYQLQLKTPNLGDYSDGLLQSLVNKQRYNTIVLMLCKQNVCNANYTARSNTLQTHVWTVPICRPLLRRPQSHPDSCPWPSQSCNINASQFTVTIKLDWHRLYTKYFDNCCNNPDFQNHATSNF